MTITPGAPDPASPAAATTSPAAERLLSQLREVLDLTCRAAVRRLDPGFWQPRPGSVFALELANSEVDVHGAPWGADEPTMAFEMAQMSMFAVEDYLTGIRKLLEPPFPPYIPKFGTAALCRSVLESAGTAFWLMDPQLTVRQRVARTLLVLWDEHKSAVKNAAKAGTPQDLTKAEADRDALLARIDELGLTRTGSAVHGERLPAKTDKVTDLLAGKVSSHQVVYSLYSAVAHGEMTGIHSRMLTGGWALTPRQLTENVELAVGAFGQLQQRLCAGGMGGSARPVENWTWENNAGRRILAVRDRLA